MTMGNKFNTLFFNDKVTFLYDGGEKQDYLDLFLLLNKDSIGSIITMNDKEEEIDKELIKPQGNSLYNYH